MVSRQHEYSGYCSHSSGESKEQTASVAEVHFVQLHNSLECAITTKKLIGIGQHFGLEGGKMAGDLFLVLGWGSPIGLGIFLALLGLMIFLFSKADELSKRTKAFAKEKGLEKKRD